MLTISFRTLELEIQTRLLTRILTLLLATLIIRQLKLLIIDLEQTVIRYRWSGVLVRFRWSFRQELEETHSARKGLDMILFRSMLIRLVGLVDIKFMSQKVKIGIYNGVLNYLINRWSSIWIFLQQHLYQILYILVDSLTRISELVDRLGVQDITDQTLPLNIINTLISFP